MLGLDQSARPHRLVTEFRRGADRNPSVAQDRTPASDDFNSALGRAVMRVGRVGLIVAALAVWVGCNPHTRRHDPSPPGPSETGDYEASGDPRFPRAGTDRIGIWYEEPSIEGGLSHSVVLKVAEDHRSAIEKCVPEDPEQKKRTEGRLLAALEVAESGEVTETRIRETSIYNRSFTDCIFKSMGDWRFEPGPGPSGATIYLPLNIRWETEKDEG